MTMSVIYLQRVVFDKKLPSPVLAPDRALSRGEGSRENCMRMLAFNQSLKFSSGPAQDGSRTGPWEYMAPGYRILLCSLEVTPRKLSQIKGHKE